MVIDEMRYKVEKSGCWVMQKKPTIHGYAQLGKSGKSNITAHRYFYEKYKGKISKGLEIDHLCKNRMCVNPKHLEAVSHLQNMRRSSMTKLNFEKVDKMKELRKQGYKQSTIGQIIGIHPSEVSRVLAGLRWGENTRGIF